MSEIHEMKTLDLQGEVFNSFPDQQARADVQKKLPLPAGAAQVGQYLRVLSVDVEGKITALEAADAPAGEGGSSSGGDSSGDSGGIETTTHGVVWDLVNVTSSSAVTSVSDGASLVAVLAPADGYTLGDVTVTMGGEALTGVWNDDTATVTIPSVNGDVTISCAGMERVGSVDTSPVIVQEDVGYGAAKQDDGTYPINKFTGIGITKPYEYQYDIEAIKASGVYDAENDYVTTNGALGSFQVYTPRAKFIEAGYSESSITTKASKIALLRDGQPKVVYSNTCLPKGSGWAPVNIQQQRQWSSVLYATAVSFSISLLDAEDSYAYWVSDTATVALPIGIRSGDIIFAGKNTPYYGMANIDGTMAGQTATTELSYDDDVAQNYAVATTSVLGDEPGADANTAYGISNAFAEVITTAKNEWMTEYGGDYRKIPIIVSTDQHGRRNKGIFDLIGKTFSMYDVSKVMNLGDTISTWYDSDTEHPLLSDSGLESWCESVKAIPFSKQLNVFGNHDTWYGNHEDEGNAIGTRYPSSQAHLNQYFRNIYARRTNNNGWFAVYDDQFNVKYVVVSAFEYHGTVTYRIGTAQMTWLIEELEKKDGYDVVIVSHVPLLDDPAQNVYPTDAGTNSGTLYRVSALDTDALFSARKAKGNGTIKDSDGAEHSYDFTACESELLCSLHGHTHYDQYLHLNDSLLVNSFDWFDDNTFFFALIDRINRVLNVWKIDGTPQYVNYQIPLDKPAE